MPLLTPLALAAAAFLALFAIWLAAAPFTHRTRSSEPLWHRIPYGLALYAGFFLIFYHRHTGPLAVRLYPNNALAWLGAAITLLSIAYAIWARYTLGRLWSGFITLKENHTLITTGPYRLTRHPIYTGFVLGALGAALAAGTVDALLGLLLITAALVYKLHQEERLLSTTFGSEYIHFKLSTPAALVPFIY